MGIKLVGVGWGGGSLGADEGCFGSAPRAGYIVALIEIIGRGDARRMSGSVWFGGSGMRIRGSLNSLH